MKRKFTLNRFLSFILTPVVLRFFDEEDDLLNLGAEAKGATALMKELGVKTKSAMEKILGSVKEIKKDVEEQKSQAAKVLENYEQWDAEHKKTMEEFTKFKNEHNEMAKTILALQKLNKAVIAEGKAAYGDPVSKLLARPDRVLKINAMARKLCRMPLSEEQQKALTSDSGVGATLIDEEFSTEFYDVLAKFGKWSGLGVRTIGKNTHSYPIKTARPKARFFRKAAGRRIPDDTNKAGSRETVGIESAGVLILSDEELMQDAEIDLSRDILGDFVEALNELYDFIAFMADGTDDEDHGAFTGMFNAGTAVSAAATHTTVAAMGYEDFIKPLTTVSPIVLQRMAKWWMHPTMLARAIGIKDGNGRPIFQTAIEAPSYGAVGSILGYPLELIHVGPNTDAADEFVAAFGDPQNQIFPVRKSFEFEESKDYKFDEYQRAFRGVGRAATANKIPTATAVLKTAAA